MSYFKFKSRPKTSDNSKLLTKVDLAFSEVVRLSRLMKKENANVLPVQIESTGAKWNAGTTSKEDTWLHGMIFKIAGLNAIHVTVISMVEKTTTLLT
jgi:hypothetical protein